MDSHHIAGKNNDPLTLPVCANCHRHLSHRQRSWPSGWASATKPREMAIAIMLRGVSDLLLLVSRKLREISDEMLLLPGRQE